MTREEWCEWLKTAVEGSELRWLAYDQIYTFNGRYSFSANENTLLLDYIFQYPEEFSIVRNSRKREFLLGYSKRSVDQIFNEPTAGHIFSALDNMSLDLGSGVQVRITFEEVFR